MSRTSPSMPRHFAWGFVGVLVVVAGLAAYCAGAPQSGRPAARAVNPADRADGSALFATNCAQCHGAGGNGAGAAPTLNAREFLRSRSDAEIRRVVTRGAAGGSMPPWGIDDGGTLTAGQIDRIVTFLRSLEAHAPSVPKWRSGAAAK